MEAQKNMLSADTLAAIQWLGMPEGTPFPLEGRREPRSSLVVNQNSESAGVPATPEEIPDHDPTAWRADFHRWMANSCVCREGKDDWGGVGTLWVDFYEWAVVHNSVPCTRRTFERLLGDAGFRLENGMVSHLLLKADLQAWQDFQASTVHLAPHANKCQHHTSGKQISGGRNRRDASRVRKK
jgi:hypothetical protein